MKFLNLTASEKDGVKVLDLTVYGDIDMGFMSNGVESAEIRQLLSAHPDAKEITQRINSRGGNLFAGLAIYNALENHGAKVTSIVEGQAGSAASIAAMAGRTVMQRGAMLMIHNPAAPLFGDAEEHRALADVLDKARDGLVDVYRKKTGKTAAELKKLLAQETWMTAAEAKAAGFANEVAAAPIKVKAEGDMVIVNDIAWPRADVPPQILAMALEAPPVVTTTGNASEPKLVATVETRAITREVLAAEMPELLAALIEEGRKAGAADIEAARTDGHLAGVAAERARLQAIDELQLAGCADLVAAAKYGDKACDASVLAVAVVKAGKAAALDLLAARQRESAGAAGVQQPAPKNNSNKEAAELAAAKDIANYANQRRQ